jgi:hypothetical protein
LDYEDELLSYVRLHGLDKLCKADASITEIEVNAHRGKYWDNEVFESPIPCNWPDLVRLHKIVVDRKVTTILEFGIGHSTLVLAHALKQNEHRHKEFVKKSLRKNNAFEIHSIDADAHFIRATKEKVPDYLCETIKFEKSDVVMGEYAGRVCSFYEKLPNICPDFIYIDGPSRYHPKNRIRNITTSHPDRVPMSADVVAIEYFLLPGTIIVIDGRTANARFLRNNLQREWTYCHYVDDDYHVFELAEQPLGSLNKTEMEWRTRPEID